jgi:hypothetical protein
MATEGRFGFCDTEEGWEKFKRDMNTFNQSQPVKDRPAAGNDEDDEDDETYYRRRDEEKDRRARGDAGSDVSSIAYSHGNVGRRYEGGER